VLTFRGLWNFFGHLVHEILHDKNQWGRHRPLAVLRGLTRMFRGLVPLFFLRLPSHGVLFAERANEFTVIRLKG